MKVGVAMGSDNYPRQATQTWAAVAARLRATETAAAGKRDALTSRDAAPIGRVRPSKEADPASTDPDARRIARTRQRTLRSGTRQAPASRFSSSARTARGGSALVVVQAADGPLDAIDV